MHAVLSAKKATVPATAAKKMAAVSQTKRKLAASVGRRCSTKTPGLITLYRFLIATPLGPFAVLTDTSGAVRWCDWQVDEVAKLQTMQDRWYKGTTLRVVQAADAAETAGADAMAKGQQATQRLERYFNPATPADAAPSQLQRELDAIPVAMPPSGPYTAKVWQTLRARVPAGEFLSYKALGELVQKEGEKAGVEGKTGTAVASRAVGQAMARNPVPVIVPCHRVLGSTQGLHGYGCGLEKKVWLLRHEQAKVPPAKLTPMEHETRVSTKESRR